MTHDKRANEWICGDGTGISSKTIWAVMTGVQVRGKWGDHPHDPADFGRCFRLLEIMPEWNDRLHEMAQEGPEWAALVHEWPELRALWQAESPTGKCPRLYAKMRQIFDSTRKGAA